jgi:DNA polymerase I-like protein with 3'-5' exonuclease and polymerase domains
LVAASTTIKFSAVNQNFGAAVFDLFLWFLIKAGIKPIMTIHDELSYYIDEGQEENARIIIQQSMDKVNKIFNFPIKFESGPEFATSYGNVH